MSMDMCADMCMDMCLGINAEGCVNEWNQTAAKITGFSKNEVRKKKKKRGTGARASV